MNAFVSLAGLAFAASIDIRAGPLDLQLDDATGDFELRVFGKTWWTGNQTTMRDSTTWYMSDESLGEDGKPNSPLLLTSVTTGPAGQDSLGSYGAITTLEWRAGSADGKRMLVTYRPYPDSGSIVVRQEFPDGLIPENEAGNPEEIVTSALTINNNLEHLRVIAYFGTQLQSTEVVDWQAHGLLNAPSCPGSPLSNCGPYTGSPLVAYNANLDAVVLGPLDNFFTTNRRPSAKLAGAVACGFAGTVEEVPQGWAHEFMLTAGTGVQDTLYTWGSALLAAGGKSRETAEAMQAVDVGISSLGYYTDNGAFYYYNTEIMPNTTEVTNHTCFLEKGDSHTPAAGCYNWERTMVDLNQYLKDEGVPVKYFQYDSWWYQKISQTDQGCDLWEPRADAFPRGMDPELLGEMPLVLHNRFISNQSRYFTEMGFEFVDGGLGVLAPMDDRFFPYIMGRVKSWGMITYEQDFLTKTMNYVPQLQSNVTLAHRWLSLMNDAAKDMNISIQYCMTQPSHVLQSASMSQVLSSRGSEDYQAGSAKDQWSYFPMNSMLFGSIALAPFKDNFWSTTVQLGNNWDAEEPNPELQALISAMSTGPVGPGDKLQHLNASLVMQTCRGDGLLLKPDFPMAPMDLALKAAFVAPPTASVFPTHTVSKPHGAAATHYLLNALRTEPLPVSPADLGCSDCRFFAFEYFAGAASASSFDVMEVNAANPLELQSTGGTNTIGKVAFELFVLVPAADQGSWTILGEARKYVSTSRQRFRSLSSGDGSSTAELQGEVGERITIMVVPPSSLTVKFVTCVADAHGLANLLCATGKRECSCGPAQVFV